MGGIDEQYAIGVIDANWGVECVNTCTIELRDDITALLPHDPGEVTGVATVQGGDQFALEVGWNNGDDEVGAHEPA